jgi:steroid delta-isomerase-like uncharacterized protein
MIARRQSVLKIIEILNYPDVSTNCRWKGPDTKRMIEDRKYGPQRGGTLMSAEENKAIVRRYWGVWEEDNLIDLIDELLAPDYVNHSPGMPDQPTGPEGVKAVVSMFRSGMPDLRVDILDMIAEGDKVAVRYTVEGTHEGDLFGVPPTGRRVSIESITVERVSDGKIREHWRVTDTLDMVQQLGAIPAPENAQVEDA